MLEVHIPLQPGESMIELRQRVRAFCEGKRIPFEQAGQVPRALALFVADAATRELLQQALVGPVPASASAQSELEAPPTVPEPARSAAPDARVRP